MGHDIHNLAFIRVGSTGSTNYIFDHPERDSGCSFLIFYKATAVVEAESFKEATFRGQ